MKVFNTSFTLNTEEGTEVTDITKVVREAVQRSRISTGIALISTLHTTCAVFVNEFQSAFIDDLKGLLEKLVPECSGYRHDYPRFYDHSHLRAALLGRPVALGVNTGDLTLGRFQSVIFMEFAGPRKRDIAIQVIGDDGNLKDEQTVRKRRRRVSIFVPAYNEVEPLEGAIADIAAAAEATLEDYEIILVDDGSTDGTGPLADRLAERHRQLRVIHQPTNQGIAAGYARAAAAAHFEYLAFFPADREIEPSSIKTILATVGTADIVAPYHGNSAARELHRRVLTFASTALVNRLFGLRLRYFQGPCVYPTELARVLPKTAGGFYFVTQMLVHAL